MCVNPQQERHERMAIAPTSFAGAAAQQRAWQVRSERPLLDWETPNETPARTKLPNSAEDRRFESISLQQRVCELSVLGAAKAWKFDLATGEAVVAGISMWRTPSSLSASTMALVTAARAGVVPPSPPERAPRPPRDPRSSAPTIANRAPHPLR